MHLKDIPNFPTYWPAHRLKPRSGVHISFLLFVGEGCTFRQWVATMRVTQLYYFSIQPMRVGVMNVGFRLCQVKGNPGRFFLYSYHSNNVLKICMQHRFFLRVKRSTRKILGQPHQKERKVAIILGDKLALFTFVFSIPTFLGPFIRLF